MKNPKRLLIAMIFAIFATWGQCAYVKEREEQILFDGELLQTLVATRDIPSRVKLDETMVKVIEVPRKWRQPKALSEIEDILGQIASNPIIEGEQVLTTKLIKPDEAGLAFYVPKKRRAVAIAVHEISAVGGHVRPGNYVDVLGTFDFGQGEKADMRTVTLFQNVWVLSVGDDIGQPTAQTLAESESTQRTTSKGLSSGPHVTLAVTPDEAQKIILAQQLGDLTLSLRSLWETERFVKLNHATINSTLGIPQRVRYRARPTWQTISMGGF